MAEVYRPERRRRSSPADDDDLPGISRLTVDELEQMGLDQIQAGITKLRESIMCAGLRLPNAQRFDHHLWNIGEPDKRNEAIREFHVELLSTLRALFLVSGGFVGWVLNGWGWSMRSGSLSVIAC